MRKAFSLVVVTITTYLFLPTGLPSERAVEAGEAPAYVAIQRHVHQLVTAVSRPDACERSPIPPTALAVAAQTAGVVQCACPEKDACLTAAGRTRHAPGRWWEGGRVEGWEGV